MVAVRPLSRAAMVAVVVAASAIWFACADDASNDPAGPSAAPRRPILEQVRNAIAVQRRHTNTLLRIPGVVGIAVGGGGLPDERAGIVLLVERSGLAGIPTLLEGVPVTVRVTGRIMAFSDPTQRQRPAPAGFSVGHPSVTAGTIGARVRDALGRVYILSNNHVLANSNNAAIGDPQYQPGPFDGGTSADQIATLADFQPISFGSSGNNSMDAAIALSSMALLDNAVPSDDGYGMPNSTIYGDADGDGLFDDRDALLGLNVQKYGRTTRLTRGQITGVNATVTVCYAVSGFTCTKSARFTDQLIISPGGFSGGGDSGSLIVTDDAALNPVGLLFAGSSSVTIANRIDLVLNRFGVAVDGFAPPPPGPLTDIAVTGISAPASVVTNGTGAVTVSVKNFGNQDVAAFDVALDDTTDHVSVGMQTVSGLAAGASATVSFAWTPTSAGDHGLVGSHTLSDDRSVNDARGVIVPVVPPVSDVAVTAISVPGPLIEGRVVNVSVTIANVGNQHVAGGFAVTLEDATAGATLGTQPVPAAGLAVGAGTTLTFSWDLSSAALGEHELVATHAFADDEAANDRRTTVVTVNPKPTDIAVTAISAPARVTVGDIVHVLVTVQNVGELDVGTSFDVVLTDGTAGGVTVGTHAVAGLAVGASLTLDIPWNTAGAATNGHILIATQKLPDDKSTNNSMAVAITVQPPADIAVTAVSAPAVVQQGGTAAVQVTVQNVGGQHVGGFDIVLSDAASGATIGTQAVPGLAMGYSTSRTINWNTSSAATGVHTVVATHTLPDGNASNDQRTASITVDPPSVDAGVTALNVPATVTRGSTVTVGVTIQNLSAQAIGTSFAVVLTDATAGVTIGTQTVSGLAASASSTRSFSWATASAALGGHTLVATHTLTDANASNNQRSATVNVMSGPPDLAVSSLTAPGQVTIGDTVPVVVTVQNVGGQDVASNFDVVLNDGTAGVTIGTQTIPGLAMGASATRTFTWNTAGVALNGHILTATQKLTPPDANSSNNQRAIIIAVNPPSLHVGNLAGSASSSGDAWSATVQITAHDVKHNPVSGVTVRGQWGGSSVIVECVTTEAGTCSVVLAAIPSTTRMVSFGMSTMVRAGSVYKSAANHDPDGSSNGYSVFVMRP